MLQLALTLLLLTTPLIEATRSGDTGAVRALLAAGADVNAPAADGATALHWAVDADDESLVTALLAAGARADVANDLAITPLHLAAANGNEHIVRALLERGANPGAAASSGVTPMMEAARAGSTAVVRALAARGARGDARETARGQTALMWAAGRGHSATVRALLEAGADLRARSTTRRMTVMLDRGPSRTVKTSMQDAHTVEAGGMTALLFAAQGGDPETTALLLAAGADVNDRAGSGVSALTLAAFSGHGAVARLLLDKGADPDAAGAGYTALHAAALRGDEATVKALIARRANLNARLTNGSPVRRFGSQWALPRTMMGATPLMVATAYLETGIMRMLLDAGADPAIPLDNGLTPLHVVAGAETGQEARPLDLVRFQIVDNDTPVVPRPEEAVMTAAGLLLAHKPDVSGASASGDTPLHAAAASGAGAVIRLLIEHGAALEPVNQAGQTPLALTLPRPAVPGGGRGSPGLPEIEALLRSLGATR
jgi:uncharacterized protein